MTKITIKTAITPFIITVLAVYIVLGLAIKKKRFVSPIFDFEYNFRIKYIPPM